MKVLFFVATVLVALVFADSGHDEDVLFVGFQGVHYATQPTPRFDHAQADHGGKIYIHGGVSGAAATTILSATHVLTTGTGAESGWTGFVAPGAGGPVCAKHASAHNADHWYIFGGQNNEGVAGATLLFSDVWAFDFATNLWSQLTTTGTGPSAKSGANAWIHNGHLYVAFGRDAAGVYSNKIHALDLETKVWEDKSGDITDTPSARFFAAGTYVAGDEDDEGHYYLFGGYQPINFNLADFHVLDMKDNDWSTLSHEGVPARSGAVMWQNEDNHLVINGGETTTSGGNSYLGDSREYNIEDDEWVTLYSDASYMPGRFGAQVSVLTQDDVDVAYIYGGARYNVDGTDGIYTADSVWKVVYGGHHCEHSAASQTTSFLAELF